MTELQLVARIKRSSKYWGQTAPNAWFEVRVVEDNYYQLRGNSNNYRLSDVVCGIRLASGTIVDLAKGTMIRDPQACAGVRAVMINATTFDVANAWNSITDRWIARRNKACSVMQYEVVHDWGGDVVSADTQKIVSRHETMESAQSRAGFLEEHARADAVIRMLEMWE